MMNNRRGFTLIELMTAVVIMAFVVAGISQVLIKQSQASQTQSLQRDQEESGRLALLEIARNVRLAGYGISPLAAFDFDRYACATPGTASSCNGGKYRDSISSPDELVLSYRDPSFSRNITAATGTTLTISPGLTAALSAGQVLQIVTVSSASSGSANYVALQNAAAVGATSLTVRTLTNADGYYSPSTAPAFTSGMMLTLVTRVRYFVQNDPLSGVPSLWKERGKGNEMLYRGIEDVQYTFDMSPPALGTGSAFSTVTPPAVCSGVNGWTFGACAGANPPVQPLETATAPDWQNDSYDCPTGSTAGTPPGCTGQNRYTAHPANIRNVNIFIVARSTQTSPDKAGDAVPIIADRPARAADTYKRTILQMTEQPQNLLARQFFMPIVLTNTFDHSVGGG